MLPLGYSTNLHAAESVEEIAAALGTFAAGARQRLGWERLGVDLRLGLAALSGDLDQLRRVLDRERLSAHTLNGFPLLPFQQREVKALAYRPDWRDPAREAATRTLAEAALRLSDEAVVTISTCPGGFRPDGCDGNAAAELVAAALGRFAAVAARLERDRGRTVILALEPEPWCLLESAADVGWFWRGPLAQAGLTAATAALDGDRAGAATALARHLGICFDTCHASVVGDDPGAAVARMAAAGAAIVKCQVSAAPEVRDPQHEHAGVAALRALAEPRFLHQTTIGAGGESGSLVRCVDLDGLDGLLSRLPNATWLRSHFHVPIDRTTLAPGLATTVAASATGLTAALAHGCRHVSVETYTWSLLAASEHQRLDGTVRELQALQAMVGG